MVDPMRQRTRPEPRMARTDRLMQAFDDGPFHSHEVAEFPPQLVELVERMSGKRFDPLLFAAYERARTFIDYQGIPITPQLRARQVLSDPSLRRADLPPVSSVPEPGRRRSGNSREAARKARHAPMAGGFDPSDLGDD